MNHCFLNIKYSLLFISLLLIACNQDVHKEPEGYTITGHLTGVEDGTIYLMEAGAYLGYTFEKVDSATISAGQFELKGSVGFPEMYYLVTEKNQTISFFIENAAINIEGNIEEVNKINISGSDAHEKLAAIQGPIDSLEDQEEKWAFIETFIEKNKKSALSPFLILTHIFNLASYDELKPFYSLLDPELTEHRYAQRISQQLNTLEAVQIGQIAPDFVLKDTTGNDISLSSFAGSYVLIDFWASWCGPCRKENPAMVELYNEVKAQNADFEIIGVAADFVESRWKNAIIKDQLPWVNVSDIKGFDGEALALFGIKSLPSTVLLDKEGKIVEKGLTGEELRSRIKEMLTL